MSSTGITFSGLASGIDFGAIVDQLMQVERIPMSLLQDRAALEEGKKTVLTDLNTRLSSLASAADSLRFLGGNALSGTSGSSSDSAVASVASQPSSPASSAQINVLALATAATSLGDSAVYTGADSTAQPAGHASSADFRSGAFQADQTLASQAGFMNTAMTSNATFTINGVSFDVDNTQSLNEILGQINSSAAGVTATYSAGILTIRSNQSGLSSEVTLSQTAGNFVDAFNLTAGTVNGSDAVVFDSSLAFNSASNHLDTAVSAGIFTVNGVKFQVQASDSLVDVLADVNASGAGVEGFYNSLTGRVSFQNTDTGSAATLTLGDASDSSNFLAAMKLTTVQAGTDASVSVNGGAAQAFSKNEVTEILPGATVSLAGLGNATLSVGAAEDSAVEALQALVDTYNEVASFVSAKLSEKPLENPEFASQRLVGAFLGDNLMVDVLNSLSELVNGTRITSGAITELSELGLTLESASLGSVQKLSLDVDAFKSALAAQPEDVNALLTASSTGLADKLYARMTAYTAFDTGAVSIAQKEADGVLDGIEDQVEGMELRLEAQERALRSQFVALETIISGMNAQAAAFNSMMAQYQATTLGT